MLICVYVVKFIQWSFYFPRDTHWNKIYYNLLMVVVHAFLFLLCSNILFTTQRGYVFQPHTYTHTIRCFVLRIKMIFFSFNTATHLFHTHKQNHSFYSMRHRYRKAERNTVKIAGIAKSVKYTYCVGNYRLFRFFCTFTIFLFFFSFSLRLPISLCVQFLHDSRISAFILCILAPSSLLPA